MMQEDTKGEGVRALTFEVNRQALHQTSNLLLLAKYRPRRSLHSRQRPPSTEFLDKNQFLAEFKPLLQIQMCFHRIQPLFELRILLMDVRRGSGSRSPKFKMSKSQIPIVKTENPTDIMNISPPLQSQNSRITDPIPKSRV